MASPVSRVKLALAACVGAIGPDILLLYSSVHSKPMLTFVTWQYVVVTFIYMGLAAVVALIFPYGRKPTYARAFGIGFSLPIAVSVMTSFLHSPTIAPRGGSIPGDLLDLLSLF